MTGLVQMFQRIGLHPDRLFGKYLTITGTMYDGCIHIGMYKRCCIYIQIYEEEEVKEEEEGKPK